MRQKAFDCGNSNQPFLTLTFPSPPLPPPLPPGRYIFWYEVGSHAGKALPTLSYLPPFKLLYAPLFSDAKNVRFHDNHHRDPTYNFGITQWLDHVCGTVSTSKCKSY